MATVVNISALGLNNGLTACIKPSGLASPDMSESTDATQYIK